MSSFRERMKKKKGGLKKKHNQPPRSSSSRYLTVFNKQKVPDGINFFVCKEATHIVDILPWEAGPNMPFDDQNLPITTEGDFDYVLDLYVHQNVGKINQPYVCPFENYAKPCPICEYMKANRLDKKEWNNIRPKRRSIYLIWNRTNAEEEKKGVQIFDAAHFFMEEKIEEIAKLPRGGGYVVFSDPDNGKSVCWTRTGSGQTGTKYLGHRFVDRETAIPDRILDKTFSLDQVINMHPEYELIKKGFDEDQKAAGKASDKEEAPFENEDNSVDDIPDDNIKTPETQGAASPKPKKLKKRKLRIRKK